jgi:hypothetical protein
MNETGETWTVRIDADTSRLQQELANATRMGRQFGNALMNAFQGIALRGRDLGDVLRSLTLSLSRMAFRQHSVLWNKELARLLAVPYQEP